ncbi:membrane-associated HD superfamily phosphohydrolase [Neobacillus niacini]|uniref:YrvL family regulatory protein n=1 Tax=Neobacillus niacini TaxID=86668 RepID=UPI002858656F|nr:YrvL family regulatory protein [Neobacillus niacini]MDR7080501.1 membrane-associated HD superfamily phosphohydrolase [Neobacillus niacini]
MNRKNKKNRFRDLGLFEKVLVITALTLLVVISIMFVIGSIFFGFVGFFNLFGVRYTSPYSLIGFLLLLFLFGGVVDLISITLIALLSRYVSGKYKSFITRMFIGCTFTWLALHIVDECMNSITIPLKTEIVAVLLLFFIEIAFENREKNNK